MVVVSGARLLARQIASRKLSVDGIVVVPVVQALMLSMSAVVFTVNVRAVLVGINMGAAWPAAKTTMPRPASMVCGKARAATGVPENETPALGLAAVPEVSRM
jgi:hypothetical protein